jgi:hypothetical protein
MIDKLVAGDLAALATDSEQRIGTFEAFMPAPRAERKARVIDPVRTRVNRIAALAAGGTALACGAGIAKVTFSEAFVINRFGVVYEGGPIFTNPWFLGFAAVALVAFAFLLAHRITAHVLDGAEGWRTRAVRLGDLAFGITALVSVIVWFLVMLDGDTTWSLYYQSHSVEVWRGHMFDIRGDCWLVLAGGFAVSLTARAIAVALTRSSSDRWSGAALALVAKLSGIAVLVTIYVMPEFGRNGGTDVGWFPYARGSALSTMYGDMHDAMFHAMYGWAYYRPEWFEPEQFHVLIGALIVLGLIGVIGVLAAIERHTQRRSRIFAVLEHRAVLGVAAIVALISVVVPMFMTENDSITRIYDATAISLVVIVLRSTLTRRRSTIVGDRR